jgi:hypothetical protein
MKSSVPIGWLVVIAILCNPAAFADDRKPAQATEPPSVVAADLKPDLDGKEVAMTIEVGEISPFESNEPKAAAPAIRIQPATKEGLPKYSVVISGDLAELMGRFDTVVPSTALAGRFIQVSGRIAVSFSKGDGDDRKPSYEITVNDWKKFRLIPALGIAERLQKKITVDFRREFLFRAVELVSQKTGVQIQIDGPGLKEVGVTQNEYQTFAMEDATATDVLLKMLEAKQLVVIIDDARKTATITSLPAANRRKPRPVLLEAPARK